MTSLETPSPEPQRSMFAIGNGSWKAIIPFATLFSIFLGALGGMLAWFDNRVIAGLDGVEMRLTAQIGGVETRLSDRIDRVEKRLSAQIVEVKADLRATETRLTDRIDEVKTDLGIRIDQVEAGLGIRIDGVKAELAAGEARRAAVDAQLSADIEQVAAGVAENRAAHRELAGFVRASRSQEPPPASDPPGPAPAQ